MIHILFEGEHENHQHADGHYSISPLTSSVVLIQTEGVNVLFDTGAMTFKERLVEELAARDLEPKDIDHVICSHYHFDHTFNIHLFAGTAIIHVAHALIDQEDVGHVFPPDELRDLPKTIEILETPGHTDIDVSLAYEWEGKTYVCAGDAVREDLIRGENPFSTTRPLQLIKSMKLIFDRADVIIPGHGRVIEGDLKNELYELINNLPLPDES